MVRTTGRGNLPLFVGSFTFPMLEDQNACLVEILFAVRRLLAFLTLPYFRFELPGWERLSALIGLPIKNRRLWARASPRTIKGKSHGLLMMLQMQDWSERLTYFLGRYYEVSVELLIDSLLNRGDTFVDVGGNIGMLTLAGAARVEAAGAVYTFEPNPELVERIREVVLANKLEQVKIFALGLSDVETQLPLTVVKESSGWGSLGAVTRDDKYLSYKTVVVPVTRGDTILPLTLAGR